MDGLLRRRELEENEEAIVVSITGWSVFGAQTRFASTNSKIYASTYVMEVVLK